jgi:FAD:protein FMN transferase
MPFRLSGLAVGLAAATLSLCACGGPDKIKREWMAMDSDFSAVLYRTSRTSGTPEAAPAESAFAALERETRRLELIFSDYLPYSALSGLRGKAGDTLQVRAPELAAVLRAAEQAALETGGSFDVTLHALKQAWGLSTGDQGRIPSDSALAAAMRGNPAFGAGPEGHPAAFPPFRMLKGDRILLLRDSVAFDLGGIAKGYAVDRMHALLDSLGWKVHLVQGGGDMRVGGLKPSGPWNIAIRHPRVTDSLAGTLHLPASRAVSTSGDYERFFEKDGVRYHHIFDPRTGRPARPWCSVTVIASESLWADALTEPLFVMGPERSLPLLARLGADAVWIREAESGLCHVATEGLKAPGRLELEGIPECAGGV